MEYSNNSIEDLQDAPGSTESADLKGFMAEVSIDKSERRREIWAKLGAVVTAFEHNLTSKRIKEQNRQDKLEAQKAIELKLKTEIAEETDENRKKKYTNQEQRDTALFFKLKDQDAYNILGREVSKLSAEILEHGDILEVLKYKFRALQAYIEIEKMEV